MIAVFERTTQAETSVAPQPVAHTANLLRRGSVCAQIGSTIIGFNRYCPSCGSRRVERVLSGRKRTYYCHHCDHTFNGWTFFGIIRGATAAAKRPPAA